MYAIVITGGRQHRAEPGKIIDVEKLPYEAGQVLDLDQVLLVVPDSGEAQVGRPTLSGIIVKATVLETYRAKKIHGFKYKPKIHYRRQWGHRQSYTRLHIDSIEGIPGGVREPVAQETVVPTAAAQSETPEASASTEQE